MQGVSQHESFMNIITSTTVVSIGNKYSTRVSSKHLYSNIVFPQVDHHTLHQCLSALKKTKKQLYSKWLNIMMCANLQMFHIS